MGLSILITALAWGGAAPATEPGAARSSALHLVENRGQWEEDVRFWGRLPGAQVLVEEGALTLDLSEGARRVRLVFEGAKRGVRLEGLDRRQGVYHFFLGEDPSRWRSDVPAFGGVRWRGLWPGIDLVLRAGAEGLKYDLVLAPGADISRVVVRCEGGGTLQAREDGSFALGAGEAQLVHRPGRTWEVLADGATRPVTCAARLLGEDSFGFAVAERDAANALVIDPGLVWSTYLGSTGPTGVGDAVWATAVDEQGDVFAVGFTDWGDFPHTRGAHQDPGPFTPLAGATFVTKLSGQDGTLLWSSILGGTHHQERLVAVAVDARGRPTAGGWTFSPDFPTTPGAYDTVKTSVNDAGIVLRLSANGAALEYSTFVESTNATIIETVAVNPLTSAATFGGAVNGTLPTTPGAFQPTPPLPDGADGFVGRLDPSGSSLVWLTYFGGIRNDQINALCVDEAGRVTVTGETHSADLPTTSGAFDTTLGANVVSNAFVTRFDPTGSSLLWSTYLGGNGAGHGDFGYGIGLSTSGDVYVGGLATTVDFPTTPGAYQGSEDGFLGSFISRFDPDGRLLQSTRFATPGTQIIRALTVDASGVPTVTGWTDGGTPTTEGAFDATFNGSWDGFVSRFDPSLSKLLHSTYLGGFRDDRFHAIAQSSSGRVTVAGLTFGPGFPTTPGSHSPGYVGGQADGFVATLELYPEGTEPLGESNPSCLGPLQLNATERPAAGSASFTLWASGAPPLARGWLLLSRPSGPGGVLTPQGILLGAQAALPIESDKQGYVETPLPLTSAQPGKRLVAQVLFRATPTCAGPRPWSTSPALLIEVR